MGSAIVRTGRAGRALLRPCLLLAFALEAGCAAFPWAADTRHSVPILQPPRAATTNLEIQRTSYREVSPSSPGAVRPGVFQIPSVGQVGDTAAGIDHAGGGDLFKGIEELTADAVVEQVLARNPSRAQMTAAWQAAAERVPQVTSWDDPMFMGVLAPASLGSNQVDAGYRVEVSQKILFPGKLKLRGQAAWAEAGAAANDIEDTRVQLREGARLAFFDYYLADRAMAVNEEGLKLLKEFQQNAEARYKTGQVPQQDILQAAVEIGRQNERKLILERMHKVARARINTLMHLPTQSPLPPPAQEPWQASSLPPADVLQTLAVNGRPDLKALAERIASEEAGLALAMREYYPDVEASAAYDTIMGNGPTRDLAPQIALKVNLPIRLKKRNAAVNESQAKIAQKRAELASKTDQVHLQVQEAYEQLRESERILKLYDTDIPPAAAANVKAAQAEYLTGKVPFLSLIEAQRNVVGLRDRYYEATAELFRRRATLERVIGGPLPSSEAPKALLGTPRLDN
jgi:outer membrane protein TolC